MASWGPAQSLLLALPDPCLLAVLHYTYGDSCYDHDKDARSLFSAARAHSRLHQAAAVVATSIRAWVTKQQQVDSVLLYLTHQGQHTASLDLVRPYGDTLALQDLPNSTLQGLSSISFSGFRLQLQPGGGFQVVLSAGAPLKRLRLCECALLDGQEGLAAALLLQPKLRDLDFVPEWCGPLDCSLRGTLQELRQLTSLKLARCRLEQPDGLEHLQGLTRLQELFLDGMSAPSANAGMLSGFQQLTLLQLDGEESTVTAAFEPAALAGLTQLQSLGVMKYTLTGGAAATEPLPPYFCALWSEIAARQRSAAVTQLLSNLQDLQQLTWLDLSSTLHHVSDYDAATVPTTAYSALTASSNLQHLSISNCTLPAGVWQHMFPAGRQLPQLQELDVSKASFKVSWTSTRATAPELSRLVSCCPCLQWLDICELQHSAELLAPLTGLSGLSQLHLTLRDSPAAEIAVVCQLKGLDWLEMRDPGEDDRLQLQLTQLKKLTYLNYLPPDYCHSNSKRSQLEFYDREWDGFKRGGPVWHQILRHFQNHSDPELAQQAAADLARSA